MGRREKKEFVESIEQSYLALDVILGLINSQQDPEALQTVTDPVEARAHRIYRALANQGIVPLPVVTHESTMNAMREATLAAAVIANDDSNLR